MRSWLHDGRMKSSTDREWDDPFCSTIPGKFYGSGQCLLLTGDDDLTRGIVIGYHHLSLSWVSLSSVRRKCCLHLLCCLLADFLQYLSVHSNDSRHTARACQTFLMHQTTPFAYLQGRLPEIESACSGQCCILTYAMASSVGWSQW